MPSIETAIETRARAFAGLTALIGASPNPTRFAPVQVAQGSALPYVAYSVISDPPYHVMGADKDGQARIQMDVFGANYAECRAVRDQLLACFDRLAGAFGGTTIDRSICENRGITLEPDEPSQIPRLTMEFAMTYALV